MVSEPFDLAPRSRLVTDIMAELALSERIDKLLAAMAEHSSKLDTISVKVDGFEELKLALLDLAQWHPTMDQAVGALQADLGSLRLRIENLTSSTNSAPTPPSPTTTIHADPRVEMGIHRSGDEGRHGPSGHRVDILNRGLLMGPPPLTTPNKGTCDFLSSSTLPSLRERDERGGKTPRMDCPSFDGEGALEWKLKCESYFRLCRIDREAWVDTAVVHFTGEAALWLQWTNAHLTVASWSDFVRMVCEKFGRREFEQLLRQFSRLRQTGTVAEYAVQFNTAMNCLLAHHQSWDPWYFVTHFVDGLRHEIRVVVMVSNLGMWKLPSLSPCCRKRRWIYRGSHGGQDRPLQQHIERCRVRRCRYLNHLQWGDLQEQR